MIARARGAVAAALLAAAALSPAGAAAAPPAPAAPAADPLAALPPPWTPGYQPQDKEERGLWMEADEAERRLKTSNFVVHDEALNAYVRGVLCRTVGEQRCNAARIYIVRTPFMNASMAPNGMMQVWTGLLLRARNEAQLAAVLGHEYGHFERRDTLRQFRDLRHKTGAMTWLAFLPLGIGLLADIGIVGSAFAYSRDMEQDADLAGLHFMVGAGYAPNAASAIWMQLRAEMDATALERRQKSRKDRNGGFFATHPNSAERVQYLGNAARALRDPPSRTGETEFRAAMASWWAPLIDDQIKLNDFGGSEFLLSNLAAGNWTGELLYARGELYRTRGAPGDFEKAADFYRQAIAQGSALPEARRGLGLALLRSGASEDGRKMLKEYVAMKPDAVDKPMMAMLAGGE
jgi:Zn-dependent protease with chaperone function